MHAEDINLTFALVLSFCSVAQAAGWSGHWEDKNTFHGQCFWVPDPSWGQPEGPLP